MKRKARKDHTCDHCGKVINKGETYDHQSIRSPKLNDNEKQIGVEYLKWKTHFPDCPKEPCTLDHHLFASEASFDHYAGTHKVFLLTGDAYCVDCGEKYEPSEHLH